MKYADMHSVIAASAKYRISTSLLCSWRFQRRLQDKEKLEVKLTPTIKVPPTAKVPKSSPETKTNNSASVKLSDSNLASDKKSVGRLRKTSVQEKEQKVVDTPKTEYSTEFIQMVTEYAKNHSIQWTAKKHGVEYKLARIWIQQSQAQKDVKKSVPDASLSDAKHDKAFIEKIVIYANNHSIQWAAKKYGVEYKLLKSWVVQAQTTTSDKKHDNLYDKALIEKVVAYAQDTSVKSASEHFSIPKSNVYEWVRKVLPRKDQVEKRTVSSYEDLEPIEKELLNWCQNVQGNETLVRASKLISKAKTICQQMSINDSQVNQDWYKYWTAKHKDVLPQTLELDSFPVIEQPKRTRKSSVPKVKPTEDSVEKLDQMDCSHEQATNNLSSKSSVESRNITTNPTTKQTDESPDSCEIAKDSSLESVSANGEIPVEEITTDTARSSPKIHTHLTRKVNRKFCKFCNSGHEHGEQKHVGENVEENSSNLKADVQEDPPAGKDETELRLALSVEVQDSPSVSRSSRTSTPSSGRRDLGIIPRDQIARACKTLAQSVNKDESPNLVPASKEDRVADTVIVISDPGWVFNHWLQQINDTKQVLTWEDVKEKLEFIVQRTHEDHFNHWLFRLYNDVVKDTNHPLINTEMVSTVLGINGYVSAEVKLGILNYAARTSTEEASTCFNIPVERLAEWKDSEQHIQHILQVRDLFASNPKNIHIDLDVYEWYLKTLAQKGEVDETEIGLNAEGIYLQHGGNSIKRWYKWFLERFQKVSAIDTLQNCILKSILQALDCNVNLTREQVISLYEESQKPQEVKTLFPTSELWFDQFYEKYSDYMTQNSQSSQALPEELKKQCDTFRTNFKNMCCELEVNCVGCMDEFPIWFSFKPDSSSNDLQSLNCGFGDADGVVLFACLASGTMLSPFITFRNSCKKSAAPDSENIVTYPVLSQWLQKVWLTEVGKPKSVVILDQFSPHTSTKFKQLAEQWNVELAFVPPGCNSALNPICSGLSAHFQKLLKELRVKRHSEEVIGRSEMLSLVTDAYSMIYKDKQLFTQAFQVTGVV